MAYLSRIAYTGNGTVGPYSIPFSYIDKSHVKVYLNGVATTAFTWLTDSSIQFDEVVTAGVTILIKRETPNDDRMVEFQNASITNSSDFNLEGEQGFYLAQESIDNASVSMGLNSGLQWEAQNKRIEGLATPTKATDAATMAYADGGNFTVCKEQADIATTQAGIATTQAGIATTQAGIATDKAEQFEAILEADGTTVKNATLAATATLAENAKGDTRFQLNGSLGTNGTGLAIAGNAKYNLAIHYRQIPAGKKLVLKRATFKLNVYLKLNVSAESANSWTSTDENHAEEFPNFILQTNSGGSSAACYLTIAIANQLSSTNTLTDSIGWWLDLAIE